MKRTAGLSALAALLIGGVAIAHDGSFKRVDSDGNGSVTMAELLAASQARMARHDADKDGRLTRQEMATHPGKAGKHAAGGHHDGAHRKAAHEAHQHGPDHATDQERRARHIDRMFERLDTNADGQIAPEEIAAATADRFRRMDKNADGVLDPDEMDRRNWTRSRS